MIVGWNSGFYHMISDNEWRHAEYMGVQLVRREMGPHMTSETRKDAMRQFIDHWQVPIFTLGAELYVGGRQQTLSEIYDHAARVQNEAKEVGLPLYIAEVWNEMNIATMGGEWSKSPRRAGDATMAAVRGLRDNEFSGSIIAGSISTVTKDGVDYLRGMDWSRIPTDLWVGIHRYPHNQNAVDAVDGLQDRDHEIHRIRQITGDRGIIVTECGPSTWKTHVGGRHVKFSIFGWGVDFYIGGRDVTLSDDQAAALIFEDLEFWQRAGVIAAVIYQSRDGDKPDAASHQGLIYTDGGLKPQGEAVKQWIQKGD